MLGYAGTKRQQRPVWKTAIRKPHDWMAKQQTLPEIAEIIVERLHKWHNNMESLPHFTSSYPGYRPRGTQKTCLSKLYASCLLGEIACAHNE